MFCVKPLIFWEICKKKNWGRPPRITYHRFLYIAPFSGHSWLTLNLPFNVIPKEVWGCLLMLGVWMLHFSKDWGPFNRTCHQWQLAIHWQIKWHSWFWLAMKHCCHGNSQWMTSCHWWQVLWNGPQIKIHSNPSKPYCGFDIQSHPPNWSNGMQQKQEIFWYLMDSLEKSGFFYFALIPKQSVPHSNLSLRQTRNKWDDNRKDGL